LEDFFMQDAHNSSDRGPEIKGSGGNGKPARPPRISLRLMQKEQSGIIAAVTAGGELGLRIREMGMIPGTRITVQGRAPLRDPVALRVLGCTLTLRNNEADFITVEVD
jgi:ferrous iron transport protein A